MEMVRVKMQQRLQKAAQWIAATKSILHVFSKETSTSQNVVGSEHAVLVAQETPPFLSLLLTAQSMRL